MIRFEVTEWPSETGCVLDPGGPEKKDSFRESKSDRREPISVERAAGAELCSDLDYQETKSGSQGKSDPAIPDEKHAIGSVLFCRFGKVEAVFAIVVRPG